MVDTMACPSAASNRSGANLRPSRAHGWCDLNDGDGLGIATSPTWRRLPTAAWRATPTSTHRPGNHTSDNIAGVLAIGEALHRRAMRDGRNRSGDEIAGVRRAPAASCRPAGQRRRLDIGSTAGNVNGRSASWGWNEDQSPMRCRRDRAHMPMNGRIPARCRTGRRAAHPRTSGTASGRRSGARGMTGPSMPFEARNALRSHRRVSGLRLPRTPMGR
jgi:hypothetical protein